VNIDLDDAYDITLAFFIDMSLVTALISIEF